MSTMLKPEPGRRRTRPPAPRCIIVIVLSATFFLCLSVSALVPADRLLHPTNLQLNPFESTSTGRGVQTTIDRPAGDVLLQIPLNETITAQNSQPPDLASRTDLTQEQRLSLALLYLKTTKNPSHDYVSQVLPQQQQHKALWTLPKEAWESRPFSLLPRCYRESFQATRDHVHAFVEANKDGYSEEDLLWAFSMVRSRSVAVPELASSTHNDQPSDDENDDDEIPLALIPGLDLCNHQFQAGTLLQLMDDNDDEGKKYWTLTSSPSKSYQAGDQIFLSYGDDKDNIKLWMTYGFVVPNNLNALAFWTWRDLLDAAEQVRPSIFSKTICQSLLQHPQLQIYVTPSERRATFSLDIQSKTPRESLQTGLTLLVSLASQLGFPDDVHLPQDALEALVQARITELRACLHDYRRPDCLSKEWEPFLQSLKLILQDELTLLLAQ